MTVFKNRYNKNCTQNSYVASGILFAFVLFSSCNTTAAVPTETLVPTDTPKTSVTSTLAPTSTPSITPSPTTPPSPTIDLSWVLSDSEWLQFYYPKDWNVEEPLPICLPGVTDCIIRLSHSSAEMVEIQFIRLRMPVDYVSLEAIDVDRADWQRNTVGAAAFGVENLLELYSVDEIEVDGIPAVKRLYAYPVVDMSTDKVKEIQYTYSLAIVHDEHIYRFRMQTTVIDEFDEYKLVVDNMVETISFHK